MLSKIALALLQPSDEAYIQEFTALSISLALVFSALIGTGRVFKVEKKKGSYVTSSLKPLSYEL